MTTKENKNDRVPNPDRNIARVAKLVGEVTSQFVTDPEAVKVQRINMRRVGAEVERVTSKNRITPRELSRMVAAISNLPDEAADVMLETLMDVLRYAILTDREVILPRFVTLKPYMTKGVSYRHTVTGELKRSPPRRAIRFVVSQRHKKELVASSETTIES